MMSKRELAALRQLNNNKLFLLRRLTGARGTAPAYGDDNDHVVPPSELGHPSKLSEALMKAADAATAWGTDNLSDPDAVSHLDRHQMLVESTRELANDWGIHWRSLSGRTDGPDAGDASPAAARRQLARGCGHHEAGGWCGRLACNQKMAALNRKQFSYMTRALMPY
jgi:hypothetical protein